MSPSGKAGGGRESAFVRAGTGVCRGFKSMLSSKVIHVDGVFLGAAILQEGLNTLRFYAAHESVRALHNACLPNLAALHTQVRRLFDMSRSRLMPQPA